MFYNHFISAHFFVDISHHDLFIGLGNFFVVLQSYVIVYKLHIMYKSLDMIWQLQMLQKESKV